MEEVKKKIYRFILDYSEKKNKNIDSQIASQICSSIFKKMDDRQINQQSLTLHLVPILAKNKIEQQALYAEIKQLMEGKSSPSSMETPELKKFLPNREETTEVKKWRRAFFILLTTIIIWIFVGSVWWWIQMQQIQLVVEIKTISKDNSKIKNAIVLLDEERIKIDSDGKFTHWCSVHRKKGTLTVFCPPYQKWQKEISLPQDSSVPIHLELPKFHLEIKDIDGNKVYGSNISFSPSLSLKKEPKIFLDYEYLHQIKITHPDYKDWQGIVWMTDDGFVTKPPLTLESKYNQIEVKGKIQLDNNEALDKNKISISLQHYLDENEAEVGFLITYYGKMESKDTFTITARDIPGKHKLIIDAEGYYLVSNVISLAHNLDSISLKKLEKKQIKVSIKDTDNKKIEGSNRKLTSNGKEISTNETKIDAGTYLFEFVTRETEGKIHISHIDYAPVEKEVNFSNTETVSIELGRHTKIRTDPTFLAEMENAQLIPQPDWLWQCLLLFSIVCLIYFMAEILWACLIGYFYRYALDKSQLKKVTLYDRSTLLFQHPQLQSALQKLRKRRDLLSPHLNIEKTIQKTIRNHGWFTPVHKKEKKLPSYLVLIEEFSFLDQQARLAEEMVARLQTSDIPVIQYYYREPSFFSDKYGKTFSLSHLFHRHHASRLVIVGDPALWLGTGCTLLQESVLKQWPLITVMTNKELHEYGLAERILREKKINVLPFDNNGIQILAKIIETSQEVKAKDENNDPQRSGYPEIFFQREGYWLKNYPPEKQQVDSLCLKLQKFLGKNGYVWLAACATYPSLKIDMTIYLGYHLKKDYKTPLFQTEDSLSQEFQINLLRLVRLPWFREGSIPDWLRHRLIDSLNSFQKKQLLLILNELLPCIRQDDKQRIFLNSQKEISTWDKIKTLRSTYEKAKKKTKETKYYYLDYVFLSFLSRQGLGKIIIKIPHGIRRYFFYQGLPILSSIGGTLFLLGITLVIGLQFDNFSSSHYYTYSSESSIEAYESKLKRKVKYKMLVIANKDYSDSVWESLTTPIQDAQDFIEVMKEKYGVKEGGSITFISNANESMINRAFNKFAETITEEDSVIIYYSGHGAVNNRFVYWIPVDGTNEPTTWVSNVTIVDRLEHIAAKALHVLLISDSYFSGQFVKGGEPNVESYFDKYYFDRSCEIIASANGLAVDDYKRTGNYPFARELIEILEKPNGEDLYSSSQVFQKIKENIDSSQAPMYGRLETITDNSGEFFFVKHRK